MGRISRVRQGAVTTEEFGIVHAKILRFFPELVRELGGKPHSLMKKAGIRADALREGKSHLTYRQAAHLVELAAKELHCADFGMRLAARQGGSRMFGPLGFVMRNSSTFGEAIDYVSNHAYAHSLAARIWLKRSRLGKSVFVGHDILLDRMRDKSQAMEMILLSGHLAAMEITGGQARVRKVHFRHQPVSPPRSYRRYFGCEVRFGENEDGVFFSARDLACAIVDPDAHAYRNATHFIDREFARQQPQLQAQARGVIMRFLGTKRCTNTRVAAELHLHPRTLHRHLKAEGTSFQQIKDEVRRDAVLYYLRQTDLDCARISERLGFAEQSVLTRRCNRWFSASPTRLRAQARMSLPER